MLLVSTTTLAILLIVMRSIYRTVELAGGWAGYVIQTERYFIALDGALMAALVIMFNVFHPGALISRIVSSRDSGAHEKNEHGESAASTLA